MTARSRGLGALLFVGALALLFVGAALSPGLRAGSSRASDDVGPDGTAAFAGVLSRLGYEVQALRLGLHVLPRKDAAVLVLITPPGLIEWPLFDPNDAGQAYRFAEQGGTVLCLTDREHRLLDLLGIQLEPTLRARPEGPLGRERALPTRPTGLARGGALSVGGRAGLLSLDDPLFAAPGGALVSRTQVGEGWVVVVADPTLATNEHLGLAGNLSLLVEVVTSAASPGARVLFDDLHAGGGDDHGVVAYVRGAGAGAALWVVGLFVLLLLVRLTSREFAVVAEPEQPAVGGAAEYVRGLGDLYARADLPAHALAVTSRRFRRAVEERAGVPWERESLQRWLHAELGPEAVSDFLRVRRSFARLFEESEPDTERVLHAAQLAARFEKRWLAHRSRPTPRT